MATTAIEMTSNGHDAAALRRALGLLEDKVARRGWPWDETASRRMDRLIVALEERSA